MIFRKILKKKEKKEKSVKPNVHFYKNGVVVSRAYCERDQLQKAIDKAKKEFGADGYFINAVTGAGGYHDLKKKKKWGSSH